MVNVIVQGSDGSSYQMVQDERVNGASGIVSLVPGENVTALMQQRGSKLPLLWELNRDGSTILSYDDTRQFFQSKLHRASWARAIAFLLFVVSIVLRIRFGAWRGNKEEPDY